MAKGEWHETTKLIEAAIAVLEVEHPMTIRQLFYRLVSAVIIQNCLPDYQKVSKAMTKARGDRRVSHDWIVDRSRASYHSPGWQGLDDLGDAMESALVDYRRDYWQDQPTHIEVWCEKDAVTGSIEEVREEYGIRVEAVRGFNSTSNIYQAACRLRGHIANGKRVRVFYLGDFDPSGQDIERDLNHRLGLEVFDHSYFASNLIRRLAIFRDDITRFDLPPLKVKMKDPRAGGFLKAHGSQAVELDALPPTELRRRIREAIDSEIDHKAWDRAALVEQAQRGTCQEYAGAIKRLMAAG